MGAKEHLYLEDGIPVEQEREILMPLHITTDFHKKVFWKSRAELLKRQNIELREALQEAVNGMEWHESNDPDGFDKADYEKLRQFKNLLGDE